MQRLIGLILLLVIGLLSLPVVAYFFDGQGTENWILPIQLVVAAGSGAVLALLLPGMVREGSSVRRRILVGAGFGIGMAVLGVVVFFLLLNGLDGA